jgi:type IV secretion system protein TrbJ
MKHRTARFLVIALLMVGLISPVFAILGVGDIVFDPTNYGQLVLQLAKLELQYQQLVQSNGILRNQYQQMLWMARQVPVNMIARYGVIPTPWQMSSASNTYGTTGGWIMGINTGLGVSAGYSSATQTLGAYGMAIGNIPGDQVDRVKTDYATVELADGANLAGMSTIGRIRANAPAVEASIQNLEDDSLSSDPEMNTEIAVLNKINAAHMITVRSTQDTNQLLASLAEQQIIEAKRQRDAEAQAINNHIRFVTDGQAVMASQASGASEAMLAWRMP